MEIKKEDKIPIYDYYYDNKNNLEYHLYNKNKLWANGVSMMENSELFGFDEDTYSFNINASKFNPNKFDLDINNYFNFRENFNLLSDVKYPIDIFKNLISDNLTTLQKIIISDTKNNDKIINLYMQKILNFIEIIGLLSHLYTNKNTKKFLVTGTGNFMNQIIPNFIFDDIIENNIDYEIFIFESCAEQDGFGCPTNTEIYNFIKNKEKEKGKKINMENIKIIHIQNEIYLINIFMFLKKYIIRDNVNIICDTIGTGDPLEYELSKINNEYINFMNLDDLYNKHIIYYMATGSKFIYFDTLQKKFININVEKLYNCEYKTNRKACPLDAINYKNVLNNDPTEDIKKSLISAGGNKYYQKYNKYKLKYLQLKNKLT